VIHNDGKKLKKKNPNMWWLVAGKVLARPHPKAKAPSFYFPKMVGDKIQRRQKSYKRLKGI
jgi:hypothetical protein